MPIEATTPSSVSAVYPYWAFTFHTSGFPCAEFGSNVVDVVSCTVVMKRFRIRDDGVPEASPFPTDVVAFTVPDLYARAAESPEIAAALQAMMIAIPAEAAARGLL